MSNPQSITAREPLINSRTVAWALSSAAVCCLVAGVLALHYLGNFSGNPQLEKEPEQVTTRPTFPTDHPTVLSPMKGEPATTLEGFGGYETLFPTPHPLGGAPQAAPRPSTATLPSQLWQ